MFLCYNTLNNLIANQERRIGFWPVKSSSNLLNELSATSNPLGEDSCL